MPTNRWKRQESHGQACFQVAHLEGQNWAHREAMPPCTYTNTTIVLAGQNKGEEEGPSSQKATKGI